MCSEGEGQCMRGCVCVCYPLTVDGSTEAATFDAPAQQKKNQMC